MEELHFDFECEPDEVRLPVPKQLLLAHPDLQLQVPKLEQLQVPKLEQLQITVEEHDEQYPVQDSDQKLHPAQKEPNEHVFDEHDTVLAVKDQHGAVPLSEGQSIVVPVHTQTNLDADKSQRESVETKQILINTPDLDQLRITVDEDSPNAAPAPVRGDMTEHSYALGTCHAFNLVIG